MIRLVHIVFALSLVGIDFVVAQEVVPSTNIAPPDATMSIATFVLKVTEVAIPALDEELTEKLQSGTNWEALIDDLAKQNRLVSYEQLHVTLYDGMKTRAQFGRRVPRVRSTSATQFGRVNNVEMENIGTLVSILPRFEPETGGVLAELEYESSRLGPNDDTAAVTSTETLVFSSTLRLTLDHPMLVTSSQRRTTTLLIAELKRLGEFRPRAVSIQEPLTPRLLESTDAESGQAESTAVIREDASGEVRRIVVESFRRLDRDEDGFLTKNELSDLSPDGSLRNPERFAELDTNDDQRISQEEYTNGITDMRGRFRGRTRGRPE